MMEGKLCVALLFLGLFSTALGKGGGKRHHHHSYHDHDDDDNHEKCPAPYSATSSFPLTCTVVDHCSVIKCSGNIDNQDIFLMMKIDKSKNPLIAWISLKVPGLDYEWSHAFKDGDQIELAELPISIDGFKSNIKFKLSLTKESEGSETDIVFELTMSAYEGNMGMEASILRGKLPLHDDDAVKRMHVHPGRCQRFKAWWNRQSHAVRAIIVISAVMVLLLSIGGVVYCCKKRRSKGTDTLKVAPPSYHEATSTETKVPLEPLVNEE